MKIQDNLLSTLDINGFISNEDKFRSIVAEYIGDVFSVPPKTLKKVQSIVKGGNILALERDAEKPQFGLNFLLNKYVISLGVVPGRTASNTGTKILAVIGISKQNDFYLTAYEDTDGNYLYAGKIKPFLAREQLFVEPVEETDDILWIDPKKFKYIKIRHADLHYSMQDVYSVTNAVIKVGKKLSALPQGVEIVALDSTESPSIKQLTAIRKEEKTPSHKEIQRLAKDEKWQALRADLNWTKEHVSASLQRLGEYLGNNPSRVKRARVFNLLNGVAHSGTVTDQIQRMQKRLREELGMEEKISSLLRFQPGDHVGFNVPVITAPTTDDSAARQEFDYLKEYYTDLKSAGSGTVDSIAVSNQFGNSYWVSLDSILPGRPRKFIVREEHLVPYKGPVKVPVAAPLSADESEEMKKRIGELEKTNPEEARRLMEKYFALTKEGASKTPPVVTTELDGHKYTVRVRQSERTTPVGNWRMEIDEDGKTIAAVDVTRWPQKDYEIAAAYVMTDTGQWEDADEQDLKDLGKLKPILIDLARKYELWSIEIGPKSDIASPEDWDDYKKFYGIEKEATQLIYSSEYEWMYSPIKGGTYGRLSWLVPSILEQSRLKDNKWDPSPLTEGDLEILKNLVKAGKRSPKELRRELNYHREWFSGKWSEEDKENIRNEVLERVTSAYQASNSGKLPPFMKDPFKPGDRVLVTQGDYSGDEGTVVKVNPEYNSINVEFPFFGTKQVIAIPYTHAKLLPPKEKTPPTPKPAEPKRQYIPVKEELEKTLGAFQPGNWHAFMQGVSPKGTKAEQLMWMYKERAQFGRPFPSLQEIMDKLNVDNTAVSHIARTLYERALKVDTPEKAREFLSISKSDMKKQAACTLGEHVAAGKVIAVDFDKTIASPGDNHRPGSPLEGAVDALKKLKSDGYTVVIHSHRVLHEKGLQEIKDWMKKYDCPYDKIWPSKPAADYYVDDKAVPFTSWKEVLQKVEKEAAFMPSIGTQPFWDQHNDGGGTGDYKYPLEALYPTEWADTWNAYANIPEKVDPETLINLLRKLKPVSKEEMEEKTSLEKKAILDMDPDIAVRFYIPKFTVTIPSGPTAGEYEAQLIGHKPPSEDKLTGIKPTEKTMPPIGKTPAEKIQEGKIPVLPVPQEGDRAPVYFLPIPGQRTPSDKPFKPLSNTSEVIYQVRYVKGPNGTPGTVVGYFDAAEFLTYTVRKGQEHKGLSEWLTKNLTDKASEISKLLERTSERADTKTRLSWQTRILQDIISEDWKSAFATISNAGLSDEEASNARKPIVAGLFSTLYRERKFKELAEAIKKFRLMPPSWKGVTADEAKERLEALDLLSGKGISKSSPDYGKQINLILDGNDVFPDGGSIEAKRKIIRDMDISRLLEYVIGDKFVNQPYAVQSAAARRLETSGTSGEEGLFALWKNKKLPASIRKDVLRALVLAYGVGKESQGYSAAGRFKATNNLLTEAAEDADADIRALAYTLMKDSSVDFLPWTNKGKLVYSPEKAESKKNQPSRDIPSWMLVQLRTEPYTELRNILYDLVEELPHDLVQEETPPKLSDDLKILASGKYSFKEDVLPGIKALLLTALQDTDPRVRARIRNWFGLPREIELLKKKEEPQVQVLEPSAKDYLFQVKVALTQHDVDTAERQLDAATKARDANEYKEEIASLKKKVKDLRHTSEEKQKLERKVEELHKALLQKYPIGGRESDFLNWISNLKFSTTYESLSAKNKEEILSLLVRDDKWFKHWSETPEGSTEKIIQPELPLDETNKWDEPFEKKGSPLSKREVIARQPPTTWELGNAGPGYSAAVPLGERDDNLLLKDVRQFYGRPEGKWRSLLNYIYNVLFKQKKEEQAVEKKAGRVEIKDREEALKLLQQTDEQASAAIAFLTKTSDEEGLLRAVKEVKTSKPLLKQLLQGAVDNDFVKVIKAVFDLPYEDHPTSDDIHVDAIRSLYEVKAIPELGKILFTPWHPLAVRYLLALGQGAALKSTFREHADRPSMQRHIVLNLGEAGDIPFLEEALKSPNQDVRSQAIEWLKHHSQTDILKKHLGTETDPKIKGIVEKYLALEDEGPIAPALDQLSPDEQEKKINELVKIATDAFTKWDRYPELRRQVLGREGRRYGISSFNEWKTVQAEIDSEIKEKMEQLPTMEQGSAAVRDLEKIVERIPESSKRTKRLQEWITEAETKHRQFSVRPVDMSEEQWTTRQKDLEELKGRIQEAKENLQKFELGPKATLEFRVEQLKLLERAAKFREELADAIRKSPDFKKEYGSENYTWKTYQAYLKTFDKDASLPTDTKPTQEGLTTLEKDRKELEKKYATPIRAKYKEQEKAIKELTKKLIPFYQKMKVNLSPSGDPQPPRISQIDEQIRRYRLLEDQWYKLSGAIEPYAEVDDIKYRISPAVWLAPSPSAAFPEYSRGKRLLPEQINQLKSPWTDLIRELEKARQKLQDNFNAKLEESVPPSAKELQKERDEREKKMRWYSSILGTIGIRVGDIAPRDKELASSKKEYDEQRKELLEKLKTMDTLREKSPEAYIKLRRQVAEFMEKYGVPPIPDTPEAHLKKQYFQDRWKSPYVRGPQMTPHTVSPGPDAPPYSNVPQWTDEDRKRIEEEIKRRIKEYGPVKDEFGEEI